MAASPGTILVEIPRGGFDRAGVRTLLSESKLAATLHKMVRAPFGHSIGTLRMLDALVDGGDLAIAAGESMQGALLEDLAQSGSLAIPEPTRDQRMFIGAFAITVLVDQIRPRLAAIAPPPQLSSDLELEGLEDLLARPPREVVTRVLTMVGRYLEVQAAAHAAVSGSPELALREAWLVTTAHAFFAQLHGAVQRLTQHGRLRPFGLALSKRKVVVGDTPYDGFAARKRSESAADLKPVRVDEVVGNREYLEAGLRLARDVAAYDLDHGRSPKTINPVLFGLGKPGCGKTVTAHAIGHYFLSYCAERDIPAKFRVIRRTDWASSYQNASAAELVRIFKEEVYAFEGVCGVYWPDIDTAFASRSSSDLRMEEKNNLGAVFGIFDGTLIPKDGKWFMICDANFMQMDEATRSRIAQNPFMVHGPQTPEDYVRLMRDILLRKLKPQIAGDDPRWIEVGQACVKNSLSGRNVEAIANNIRSHVEDFEYPDEYFRATFAQREEIVAKMSRKVSIDDLLARVESYVTFQREAEEKAERERFDKDVEEMVRQLNAGRAAAERAANLLAAQSGTAL